ncbi:N(5)-(carboxyethyl)ornithine synthase [soil metagenome]
MPEAESSETSRATQDERSPTKGQPTLGVVGQSSKENEWRLPIHPLHLSRIQPELLRRTYLEQGYGLRFGITDELLNDQVAGLRSRDELVADCDILLLPKPQPADLSAMRQGQVLWGWPHCVQDEKIAQLAIERRLTLIAFEAMNHWRNSGEFSLHVFHKNNEMAGYCSVLHALELVGSTGDYGRTLNAAVIGFGSTARGAVTALNAHGISDVTVLSHRSAAAVGSPIHSARILQLEPDDQAPEHGRSRVQGPEGPLALAGFLAGHDIIVNCVLQDPEAPMMFLLEEDIPLLSPGTVIVDVSCDEAMGFSWARPTSFEQPTFCIGANVVYYGVDHSPSYLWNSATWENSEALLPFLPVVLGGSDAWHRDQTIRRAIEIRDGVVQNPAILSFQNRSEHYPHDRR